VCPEVIAKIEEEISASSMEIEIRRPEVLRALHETLGAEAKRCWTPGRLPGLSTPPFLLAFLCQLTAQGWGVAQGETLSRPEAKEHDVWVLRNVKTAAGSPHQRGLDGQQPKQLANAVHFLSQLLARYSQEAWGHNYETYAEIGFPLGFNATARVGRLRAYGNAIVSQVAQEVIAAYMSVRP